MTDNSKLKLVFTNHQPTGPHRANSTLLPTYLSTSHTLSMYHPCRPHFLPLSHKFYLHIALPILAAHAPSLCIPHRECIFHVSPTFHSPKPLQEFQLMNKAQAPTLIPPTLYTITAKHLSNNPTFLFFSFSFPIIVVIFFIQLLYIYHLHPFIFIFYFYFLSSLL